MNFAVARIIFAVLGLSFAFGGYAQDKSSGDRKVSSSDRSFIMQATNGGMTEIELSRIALKNSANADVKAFAQRLVEDHGKAGKELEAISAKLGATPPKTDPKQQGDMKRFAELKGEKLDKALSGSTRAQLMVALQLNSTEDTYR